jgi:hypothetical protein
MNLNETKEIFRDNGFGDAFTYYDSFLEWICKKENAEMTDTFKSIKDGIEQVEKNLDDIDKRFNSFMSARDTCYPRQYPKQKGNFPQHYPKAKSTPPKKKIDPIFQEREKSDAGKLADKFTELLKKK